MAKIAGFDQYFWDTSALAKRYAQEEGSDIVVSIMDDSDTISWISSVSLVEIHKTLVDKLRGHEITDLEYGEALVLLDYDTEGRAFYLVGLRNQGLAKAIGVTKKYGLHCADSMILGTALTVQGGARDRVLFVTCDEQQRKAAVGEGYFAYDPQEDQVFEPLPSS